MTPGRLEDPDRADDVHVAVVGGTLHRDAHVRLRGQMDAGAGLDPVEQLVDGGLVPDVPLDELDIRREVFGPSARKVVQNDGLVASCDQGLDDVRADESSSPGDDQTHDGAS